MRFCSSKLTWRDVQHIVVRSANPTPLLRNGGWQTNGAGLKGEIIQREYARGAITRSLLRLRFRCYGRRSCCETGGEMEARANAEGVQSCFRYQREVHCILFHACDK